jgi:hypothetical protein
MGVPQPGLRLNALCSLGILAVVAAIAIGLPALDRALPRERAVAPGVPYAVTDTVSVVPPAGARLDVGETRPGGSSGYAVFVIGRVRFAVLVSHENVTLPEAADRLRTRLQDSLRATTTADDQPLTGGTGPALAGRFKTGAGGGWYAVRVIDPATVVDVTASGPPGELADRLPAIEASAAGIGRPA